MNLHNGYHNKLIYYGILYVLIYVLAAYWYDATGNGGPEKKLQK